MQTQNFSSLLSRVSIPQAVWIACNLKEYGFSQAGIKFQYRKRYGLHAMKRIAIKVRRGCRFNTASGMDCMQFDQQEQCRRRCVSIPQAVWIACNRSITARKSSSSRFQYRKRYGLHAMARSLHIYVRIYSFQYRKRYGLHAILVARLGCSTRRVFQYRKRYGLHAIFYRCSIRRTEKFQYRKRYGLHAMKEFIKPTYNTNRFNTASGMDCMQ